MRSYEEILNGIYDRAEKYRAARRERRERAIRVIVPCFCAVLCLAVLGTAVGIGLNRAERNGADIPSVPAESGESIDRTGADDGAKSPSEAFDPAGSQGDERIFLGKPQTEVQPRTPATEVLPGTDSPASQTSGPIPGDEAPIGFFTGTNAIVVRWQEIASRTPVWTEELPNPDGTSGAVVNYYRVRVERSDYFRQTMTDQFAAQFMGVSTSSAVPPSFLEAYFILVPDCYLDRVKPGEMSLLFLDYLTVWEGEGEHGKVSESYPVLRANKYYGGGKFTEPDLFDFVNDKLVIEPESENKAIWTSILNANVELERWMEKNPGLEQPLFLEGMPESSLYGYFRALEDADAAYRNPTSVDTTPADTKPIAWDPVEWEETSSPAGEEITVPVSPLPMHAPVPQNAWDLNDMLQQGPTPASMNALYETLISLTDQADAISFTVPAAVGAYIFDWFTPDGADCIYYAAEDFETMKGWMDAAAFRTLPMTEKPQAMYRLLIAAVAAGYPDRILHEEWVTRMNHRPASALFVSFDSELRGGMEKYISNVLGGDSASPETYLIDMSIEQITCLSSDRAWEYGDLKQILAKYYGIGWQTV